MTYRARIYLDNVSTTAFGIRLDQAESPIFEGEFKDCATFLESLGNGVSVAIHHDGGIRSCMNKPALRQWLRNRDSAIVAFRAEFVNAAKGKPFNVPAIDAGIVGEYFNSKPFKPDLANIADSLPYRYRKSVMAQLWHERGFGPNDGTFKLNIESARGKFLAQIRFTPIRADS